MQCSICLEEIRRHELALSFGIMGNEKPYYNDHFHFNCFCLKIKDDIK